MKNKEPSKGTLVDFKKVKDKKTAPSADETLQKDKEEGFRLFKETFMDAEKARSFVAVVLDDKGEASYVTSATSESLIVPFIGAIEVIKAALIANSFGIKTPLDGNEDYE